MVFFSFDAEAKASEDSVDDGFIWDSIWSVSKHETNESNIHMSSVSSSHLRALSLTTPPGWLRRVPDNARMVGRVCVGRFFPLEMRGGRGVKGRASETRLVC